MRGVETINRFFLISLPMCLLLALVLPACSTPAEELPEAVGGDKVVSLPPLQLTGGTSVEEALYSRVSRRNFTGEPVSLDKAAQVLWAAQGKGVDGVTGASRTAPSAGATHPMEIYLVAGRVEGLKPGVYRYDYLEHSLILTAAEDLREGLAAAALNQRFIAEAPAGILLAADYSRTTARYGERGVRYVHMEVGHITQNIYLQCESLGLGAVAVGAFADEGVRDVSGIKESPLMIIPFGKAR